MKQKKIMVVNRSAPHGTINAQESLDVILIGAAFEQDVSLAFLGDGVSQLRREQQGDLSGAKNVAKSLKALGDYDIRFVYVEQESMEERGLTEADLIEITHEIPESDYQEMSSLRIISRENLSRLMSRQNVLLTF